MLKISGFNDITLYKRQSIQDAVRKAARTNRETHYSNSNKSMVLLSLYYRLKNDLFFDETSKTAYNQLAKNSSVESRVTLNIEQFEIGSRYVTAKVQNRY